MTTPTPWLVRALKQDAPAPAHEFISKAVFANLENPDEPDMPRASTERVLRYMKTRGCLIHIGRNRHRMLKPSDAATFLREHWDEVVALLPKRRKGRHAG